MMSISLLTILCCLTYHPAERDLPARDALEPIPGVRFHFRGELGRRIEADVEQWLLPAPRANPGLLEMFELRDRRPVPQLVPWAGEFVGKYLISAIQALRMVEDPRLERTTRSVIDR